MQISLTSLVSPFVLELRDVTMSAGLSVVSSVSQPFQSTDVGKVIVVSGAGANSVKLCSTITSYISTSQVVLAHTASLSVTNAGAVFGTDCSTALQNALGILASNEGGRLLIDGLFMLSAPVTKDFGGEVAGVSVQIEGTGSDSALWIAVPSTTDAITLSSAKIGFRGVNFIGVPGASIDAKRVLNLYGVNATFNECGFYGLIGELGIIYADGCSVETARCDFGGSFALGNCGVIQNKDWVLYEDHRSEFIDHGRFRGELYGKSGFAVTKGWVRADSPTTATAARGHSVFRLEGSIMDEGAIYDVMVKPTSGRITHVHLSGVRLNVNVAEGGRGFHIEKADSVVIEGCRVGLAPSLSLIGHLQDCSTVLIDSLETDDAVTKLSATNINALTIKDSPGITSVIFTNVGFHPVDSRLSPFAAIKEGATTDADFLSPPAIGTIALDRSPGASKVLVKRIVTGGWIYDPSELDGGDPYGPEMIPAGTSGWLPVNSASISGVGGAIRVTNGGSNGRAYRNIPTVIGQKYQVSVGVTGGTAARLVRVGGSQGDAYYYNFTSQSGGSGLFTAISVNTVITLMLDSTIVGAYAEFSPISLKSA